MWSPVQVRPDRKEILMGVIAWIVLGAITDIIAEHLTGVGPVC